MDPLTNPVNFRPSAIFGCLWTAQDDLLEFKHCLSVSVALLERVQQDGLENFITSTFSFKSFDGDKWITILYAPSFHFFQFLNCWMKKL